MRRVAMVAIVSVAVVAVAASWSWAGTATRLQSHGAALRIPRSQLRSLASSLRQLGAPRVGIAPRLAARGGTTCFVAARGGCSLTPCVYETTAAALVLHATPATTCRRPTPIQISTTVLSAVPAGQPPAARATK
jgi:hypothetical protein